MILPNIVETSMRVAFSRPLIGFKTPAASLGATMLLIAGALKRGVGIHRPKQMWNASVSYRTYQSLKNQGVLS